MNERVVSFGPEQHLVGTLTEAEPSARRGSSVVLVNAGVIHRIGPHRIYVKLARILARSGHDVLRFDLAGTGDSRFPIQSAPMLQQAVQDIGCAVDLMETEFAGSNVTLAGVCSGAMNAFRASLADERVMGLVMFDGNMYPTRRTWVRRQLGRLHWRAVLRAVRLLTAPGEASQEAGAAIDAADTPDADLGRLPIDEYASGMRQLIDRGVQVRLLYSGSFPAFFNYAQQFSDRFRAYGIADSVQTAYLPHVDHVITLRSSQRAVIDAIDRWLASDKRRP